MKVRAGFWRRLSRMRVASAGFVIFGIILVAALSAGYISPAPPDRINLDAALERPSIHHPFGTDPFGRDVLARIVHGSRISLGVGFLARTISLLIGLFLGSLAGYRYCDLLLSQGQAAEVLRQASQTRPIAERNRWLLDIGLDHLWRTSWLHCWFRLGASLSTAQFSSSAAITPVFKLASASEAPPGRRET